MENVTGEGISDQIERFQTQLQMDGRGRKHRILMVSDFFFPNFGGVESHIYYLSQCLLKLGHKVIVMTHAYGNRSGVRYVTGGLKVYYVPWKPFLMQNTLPTLFLTFPIVRTILIREKISVVHGHQAFSTLCHEALMHARTMGKENTVLRSGISPEKVFMVPNAVDTAMFTPSPDRLSCDEIVIVVISRLVYRKGADLLVEVIPEVCRLFPKVRFIVGGDGPKRVRIEEMREKFSLQDRVEMLGAVPHAQVLPDDMVVLAEPAPEDMVRAVRKAIDMLPGIDPQVMHLRMKKLYSWDDVAKRTEIVYDRAMQSPQTDLLERLPRCGAWAGKLFCLVMIINYLLWCLLEYLQPTEGIEEVPDIRPVHARLESVDDTCETQGKGI
uniref:Phosphatidylinositol N-acetylglucosaminyltransferase n=1 Tax=Oryza nivara TaxID=4536 RepID=A0A0E0FW77_ORYNI